MRAIDLFAGAGGLSLGLIQAGIDVVAAVERDPDACASYRANLGDHLIEAAIEDVAAADLPDCDLIAGGPPCQGFSYAGKRDKNDPRNQLWREFFRIVEGKQPDWILVENVRGFLTAGEDKPLILAFRDIGYHVSAYLLNAADYGVPQRRLRVFFVGNRIGLANPCPTPTHAQPPRHLMFGVEPWVTVRQALGIGGMMTSGFMRDGDATITTADTPFFDGDTEPARAVRAQKAGGLAELGFSADERVYSRTGTKGNRIHHFEPLLDHPSLALRSGVHGQPGYSPRHQAGYVPTERTDHGVIDLDEPSCVIKTGGNREADGHMGGACPPSIAIPDRFRNRYAEHGEGATLDDPAPTISADRGLEHTSGVTLRRLTVRECATLQDFPPSFTFHGSKTSQYRSVGNAVAVGMARALGEAIGAAHRRRERV